MEHARLVDGGLHAVRASLAGRVPGIAARTSGSTGQPREVLLSSDALISSAHATLERLGGPAHWLLALPTDRIAGAMVCARALVSDGALVTMDDGPFAPHHFAGATDRMPSGRRYVSLVPTQVRRLLAHPAGAAALATFDAVLVGGAPPGMELPANAVETYGMTETSGGCVYDGTPLPGVEVRTSAEGRIELAGPMLADGYADGDNSSFTVAAGTRWFRTSDVGQWDGNRLSVRGRSDDVIITGGHNVHPTTVEHALLQHPTIADAVVTSVPHPQWGEQVTALVVPQAGPLPSLQQLRAELDAPRYALPHMVLAIDEIPRTQAGKIDRASARAYAIRARETRTPEES